LDEAALLRKATNDGLNLWPISAYCIEPLPRQGLIFGYGVHTVPELQDAVRRLAAAMQLA
jgi:DNA-binding transcriptional MocR family regulator